MTTPYTNFLPEVLPYLRDCPDPVAVAAIRDACIDFCDRTLWWQFEHPSIPGVAGTAGYTLSLPAETSLSQVVQAFYSGVAVEAVTPDQLNASAAYLGFNDWRDRDGTPTAITQLSTGTITLYPNPVVADATGLKLIVALRPTRASTGVLDDIYERFAEAIAFGARARVLAQPMTPNADEKTSHTLQSRFLYECSRANIQRSRAQGRVVQVLRPPTAI